MADKQMAGSGGVAQVIIWVVTPYYWLKERFCGTQSSVISSQSETEKREAAQKTED